MLHIILGILKIIGIFIGILSLFLLACLLALVFVPVRYRLSASVQPEPRYAFALRMSWLLHIVSIAVTMDASQGRRIAVRLFGIRLPLFRSDSDRAENAPPGAREKAQKKTQKKAQKKTQEKAQKKAPKKDQEPDDSREKQTEAAGWKAVQTDAPEAERTEELPDSTPKAAQKTGAQEIKSSKRARIRDKIRHIIQGIREFGQRLVRLKQRAAELRQRLIGLLRRPGELMEFLEKYEAREVFGTLAGQLVFLIAHYKPRRIEGYLRFGTGNPSTTGQLTGLIYILLPARADRYSVEPEFTETVFETETACTGHIRALHVLRVLWRVFRDKKIRRIIARARKKAPDAQNI